MPKALIWSFLALGDITGYGWQVAAPTNSENLIEGSTPSSRTLQKKTGQIQLKASTTIQLSNTLSNISSNNNYKYY
jgi:hypothetical protein